MRENMKSNNIISGEKLQYMNQKLEKVLKNPSSGKKQIAFNVHPNLINDMDELAITISKISGKPYTRNSLVEDAVEIYIKEARSYIQKHYPNEVESKSPQEHFDLVIYPATEEGYHEVFLAEKEWYYVRIQKEKVNKIKYIALYVKKPIGCILAYAKVKNITYIEYYKKYILQLENIQFLKNPVKIGELSSAVARSPKYTTLEKLLNAHTYADL